MEQMRMFNDIKYAYVTVGLPASGKTYYYYKNRKKLSNFVYIDSFMIAKRLFREQILYCSYDRYKKLIECNKSSLTKMLYDEIKDIMDSNLYIGNCNLDDKEREELITFLKSLGYTVKVLRFNTDPFTCVKYNERSIRIRRRLKQEDILKYCREYVFLRYSSKLAKEADRLGYNLITIE